MADDTYVPTPEGILAERMQALREGARYCDRMNPTGYACGRPVRHTGTHVSFRSELALGQPGQILEVWT